MRGLLVTVLLHLVLLVLGGCKPTPAQLVAALARGDASEVEKLLVAGADPNAAEAVDSSASRPLSKAVATGNVPLLKVLLAHGADPRLADPGLGGGSGYTPLGLAAYGGRAEAVRLLLAAGAPVESGEGSETPLALAAQSGDAPTVEALLGARAQLDPAPDATGYPPLVIAAEYGHLPIVARLVEAGVPVDRRDKLGATALLYAAAKGHVEIAGYLLAHGASAMMPNRAGWTPAFAAKWNDQRAVIDLFEKAGVTDWDMKVPPADPPSGWGTVRVPVVEVQGR